MTENKLEKKAAAQRKIVCKGPKDKTSGAAALRVQSGIKKNETVDIREGQTLVIGRDVSEEIAAKLLEMNSWKFEEAKS